MVPITRAELNQLLQEGIVDLTYKKVNGEIRKARATLKPSCIPPEMLPKTPLEESTVPRPLTPVVTYFDVDKLGWRSFHFGSLVVESV